MLGGWTLNRRFLLRRSIRSEQAEEEDVRQF
jgi:hypothetical protein